MSLKYVALYSTCAAFTRTLHCSADTSGRNNIYIINDSLTSKFHTLEPSISSPSSHHYQSLRSRRLSTVQAPRYLRGFHKIKRLSQHYSRERKWSATPSSFDFYKPQVKATVWNYWWLLTENIKEGPTYVRKEGWNQTYTKWMRSWCFYYLNIKLKSPFGQTPNSA